MSEHTEQNGMEAQSQRPQPGVEMVPAKRINPNRITPITKQNAREMALRSHALRRERTERLRQAAEPIAQGEQEYRVFRLTRTREQLLALDRQLEKETDPKAVKAICDAIARLCDVEQRLAMRPLPGSQRPTRQRTPKSGAAEPLDE